MAKKIGIALGAVVIILLVIPVFLPSTYVISRQTTVHATSDKVFPFLNSAKLADQWGPWKEVDPAAKMVLSGPEEGVGAKTSWDGTGPLGTGSATIIESTPNERVTILLDYERPMKMMQKAQYLVRQEGEHTTVTWRVEGENNYVGRLMCLFMNMDKHVGGMFEKGLANLKTLVEKS